MDKQLESLRKEIDVLDKEIVERLAKRMDVVKKVGEIKKQNGVAPLAPDRWQQVLESKKLQAKGLGISGDFIEKMYILIHEYSLKVQKDLGATVKRKD